MFPIANPLLAELAQYNWLPVFAALLLLAAVAVIVLTVAHVPVRWGAPTAIGRAVLQLGILAIVLRGVITNVWWVLLALVVMFTVAATTAAKRLGFNWRLLATIAASMICGVLVALTIVFSIGAIEFNPRNMLALGGIIVGNSMTIATLAGRRFYADANKRWDEVEGWLSVGATPRQSTTNIRREAIHEALIPSLDQTRTVGLVTLPGTFVGALLGGAPVVEAGIFQVVALACVLAAGSITSSLLLTALAALTKKPAPAGK